MIEVKFGWGVEFEFGLWQHEITWICWYCYVLTHFNILTHFQVLTLTTTKQCFFLKFGSYPSFNFFKYVWMKLKILKKHFFYLTHLCNFFSLRDAFQKNGKKSDIVTRGGGLTEKPSFFLFWKSDKVLQGGRVHGMCHSVKYSPLCLKILK